MRKKRSIYYIFSAVVVMVTIAVALYSVNSRVERFNNRLLQKISDEKAFLVNKELDFLKTDVFLHHIRDSLVVSANQPFAYPTGDSLTHRTRYIDLQKLTRYFMEANAASQAYFELFDKHGRCLVSPELAKVGRYMNRNLLNILTDKGKRIRSDYLQLDVFATTYPSNELFDQCNLVIYVPYVATDTEVRELTNMSMLFGIGTMIIVVLLLLINFSEQRTIQRLKMESLKQANHLAQAQLVQLKEQINPHFLFNALGSLQYLIGKDDIRAKTFVAKMTKVYRKMLHTGQVEWSPLSDDLELAQAYFFLQKTRFGDGLEQLEIKVNRIPHNMYVPRLALQILVENAIKHTTFSVDQPLRIKVVYDPNTAVLEITNSYTQHERTETEGEGYGLRYLKIMYESENVKGFQFGVRGNEFYVNLPLVRR